MIKEKLKDFISNLLDKLIGTKDIHSVQRYLNRQGLLVYNHYDAFNDQIYDVYFNLSNLDNVIFKCEAISFGRINSSYIKTFNNKPYLHIGKFDCDNQTILCYKYLTNFTIENINGEYISHCKFKELFRIKNLNKILFNQIEELKNLPLQLKEFREQKLLDDINKDF